jgi:DNA-binding beta-propeller fold protein YncE
MKKTLLLCSLLLIPVQALANTPPAQDTGALDWSVQKTWKLSTKPVDFAQTLDNKMVYVLGEDSKVHIYSVGGKEMGAIPVDKSTVAIDIAPRGEMLYLVDGNNTYTSIDISFTQKIDVSGSPFLGKENAPVTMVVFSDFQ